MLKALIIDFDGDIIDTERVHFDVNQIWFKDKLGIELPLDDYVVCVGANLQVLLDHINQKYATDLTVADIPDDGHAEVERRTNELPLLPCVRELIDAAKERGLLVTLCTSSRRARAMKQLRRLGIREFFDHVTTADDVARVKPHPDLYLKALEKAGVKPDEALVIEDSRNGLLSAQAAGIPCLIAHNTVTSHLDFTGAYKVTDSLCNVDLDAIIADFA